MNTTGCSFLVLAAAALVVGFIPILTWINLVVALPLSLIGIIAAGNIARKRTAQPADKSIFWITVGLAAVIILRIFTIQ